MHAWFETEEERNMTWEDELFARHRWGQHGEEQARREHDRLRSLWDEIPAPGGTLTKLIDQVIGPEICNWRLEEMVLLVCGAIGAKSPLPTGTGHMATMTTDRWLLVWTYYLSLRSWLNPKNGGYGVLLEKIDFNGKTQNHISGMLSESNELKELYVERLCLCFDVFLADRFRKDSADMKAHASAVTTIEQEIARHDPESQSLKSMQEYSEGEFVAYINLELCHHKFFRRLDIIISSIGSGKWRGGMPIRGTDGFYRADLIDSYVEAMRAWTQGKDSGKDALRQNLFEHLGNSDEEKRFLVSLFASLLHAQVLAARKRAERNRAQPSSGAQ